MAPMGPRSRHLPVCLVFLGLGDAPAAKKPGSSAACSSGKGWDVNANTNNKINIKTNVDTSTNISIHIQIYVRTCTLVPYLHLPIYVFVYG